MGTTQSISSDTKQTLFSVNTIPKCINSTYARKNYATCCNYGNYTRSGHRDACSIASKYEDV